MSQEKHKPTKNQMGPKRNGKSYSRRLCFASVVKAKFAAYQRGQGDWVMVASLLSRALSAKVMTSTKVRPNHLREHSLRIQQPDI